MKYEWQFGCMMKFVDGLMTHANKFLCTPSRKVSFLYKAVWLLLLSVNSSYSQPLIFFSWRNVMALCNRWLFVSVTLQCLARWMGLLYHISWFFPYCIGFISLCNGKGRNKNAHTARIEIEEKRKFLYKQFNRFASCEGHHSRPLHFFNVFLLLLHLNVLFWTEKYFRLSR